MDREAEAADRLGIFILHRDKCALFYFRKEDNMKKVAIIMGSDSDLPVVRKAAATLNDFGVPYEAHVFFGAPHTRTGKGFQRRRAP